MQEMYKPIENKDYPGFFEIPGYSRYLVNEEGVVIKKVNGEKVKLIPHLQGYYRVSIFEDKVNTVRTVMAHRLGCMAFHGVPPNDKPYVNHRNGDKSNGHFSNLEWASAYENNMHAINTGLRKVTREVLSYNVLTNEVIEYKSLGECCSATGVNIKMLNRILKNKENVVRYSNLLFRYVNELETYPWPTTFNKAEVKAKRLNTTKEVVAMRLSDKTLHVDSSPTLLAKLLNIPEPTVFTALNEGRQYIRQGYLIKYMDDPTPWMTEEELKSSNKFAPKQIRFTNTRTGEVKIYDTKVACSKDLEINISTIMRALKRANNSSGFSGYKFEEI